MIRVHFWRRNDLSGLPYGFWIGWRPREQAARFSRVIFKWSFGAYWYPWWRYSERTPWSDRIPRFHFNGEGPLGPTLAA